jgi:hypothetical protein
MTVAEARRFVFELDLDVDKMPICLACLSIVSMSIDEGNPRKINGAVRSMTPDLWAEGLELPAWTALEEARDRGIEGAEAAIADVLTHGARGRVARAIVRRLGEQLSERAGGDPLKMGFQPWPPPGERPSLSPVPPPGQLLPPGLLEQSMSPLEMEVRVWTFKKPDN